MKPSVTQILLDTSSHSADFILSYHALNKFYPSLRTSPLVINSHLANVYQSLCQLLFFILFYFFSFHVQAEHLQFTADSTCTEGEISEVQFGRLKVIHRLADGLQHLQNFLK